MNRPYTDKERMNEMKICTCEICGEEYEENTMFYDDTCDECAKEEGLEIGE